MKFAFKIRIFLLCFLPAVALFAISCKNDSDLDDRPPTPLAWSKPAHFPEPAYDMSRNPLTEEGVELGRFLFYDGILSRTNQIGCGTCHQQEAAFTHHGHELSHGVDDLLGTRNSPAVQNMAWSSNFFWDGGVHDLDLLPLNPITNPVEMDETLKNVLAKLKNTPSASAKKAVDYPRLFKRAFGTEEITTERMMKAMSQFMLTMVSAESRYDDFVLGKASALSATEQEGLSLFKSKCSTCHSGELFTDGSFRNNGLVPLSGNDQGRFGVTAVEADRYKFKVPSLRNVGLTAPYMHDGRHHTLREVLDHYANDIYETPTLDPVFKSSGAKARIPLTEAEKTAIIAFLNSLTDTKFVKNTKFSDPGVGNAF